ncbi:MAG: hypothetical protein KDN20_19335 [Verrucomicrobiae bacterium]|nr:hypothetical protein [Verrucomicrobiae bacterium]
MKQILIGILGLGIGLSASAQEYSVSLSFENLGTTEETTADLDGVPLTYPVDEADVITLLRPALTKFRDARKQRAKAEANGLREAMADPDVRALTLNRVKQLIGKDSLSSDIDKAYEKALKEIAILTANWEKWSGDLGRVHLYNHATVAPFRKGENRIEFEQVHFLVREGEGYEITLHPPFVNPGAGIGAFDIKPSKAGALKLDILVSATPGNSAETVAADLEKFLGIVQKMEEQLATEGTLELIQSHLIESLLRHEIRTTILAPKTSLVLIRGLARYYLMAYQIIANRESPDLSQRLMRLGYFPVPTDETVATSLLEELAQKEPLSVTDTKLVNGASRVLAWNLLKLSQTDPKGTPVLQYLAAQGIPVPEGGFDQDRFATALSQAYPDLLSITKAARAETIQLARAANSFFQGKPEKPETPKPFFRFTNRTEKTIDGYTFTYPKAMEAAIAVLAPEWVTGLKKTQQILEEQFPPGVGIEPPAELDDACLERLGALGLTVNRDMANSAATTVAGGANVVHYVLPFLTGKEIQIHVKSDLVDLLKEGAPIEDFSLSDDGEKISFNFKFTHPSSQSLEQSIATATAAKPAAIPVIAKLEGDVAAASLDDQIKALREGSEFIDIIIRAAEADDEGLVEQFTQRRITVLTEKQSWFVTAHELTEGALVTQVIASDDRRWFCDGVANAVAIRECDHQFGQGEGRKIFESLWPPEQYRAFANQIDLLGWPALGDESASLTAVDGLAAAHYYFATEAMLAALEGRGDEFLGNWIRKIRETSWNRTNAETVLAAYQELTGEDLKPSLKKP